MLEKGIIIFALKHALYGRLAYNLAITIKAIERDFPIAVVRTPNSLSHLSDRQLKYFDHIIDLPENLPHSCGAKLWAYELSPFKTTLLLDADMLWLPRRKPSDLFEELKDVQFTAVAEGYKTYHGLEEDVHPKYFFWADVDEIGAVYNLPEGRRVYQWRSETIFFQRSADVSQVFELAQEVFLNPRLATVLPYATGVPDELGLNVACAVYDVHPHRYQWHPAYWHMLHGGIVPGLPELYEDYYLATFGSNMANSASKLFYDKLMKTSSYKLGLRHVFPLQSKRDYLPERQKI